jgi:hypothetical protein
MDGRCWRRMPAHAASDRARHHPRITDRRRLGVAPGGVLQWPVRHASCVEGPLGGCDERPQTTTLRQRLARRLRQWRYGPSLFKADFALAGPGPWASDCVPPRGGVHLGNTAVAITRSVLQARIGEIPTEPAMVIGKHSLPALAAAARWREPEPRAWRHPRRELRSRPAARIPSTGVGAARALLRDRRRRRIKA